MVIRIAGKNDRYTYRVTWSEEDQEYVGLCAEFPSLSWLAVTQEEAWQGINDVVAEVVVDMESNHEPLPEPISTKHYSGKFSVRIPPELHRRLAGQAAEEQISINRLVSTKLAIN